jgi:hypothetical protein
VLARSIQKARLRDIRPFAEHLKMQLVRVAALCTMLSSVRGDGDAAQSVQGTGGASLRGTVEPRPDIGNEFVQMSAQVPSWCQFVPDTFKGVACTGARVSTPEPEDAQTSGNATQNGTVPAWCQFVPTPFQSVACRGSGSGCQCKDWCSSTSVASREWNPECCGCSADLPFSPGSGQCTDEDVQCSAWAQAGQCSTNPDYMQQNCRFSCGLCRSPTETPDTPARHSTQQGRVPAWCQFVPTPFQSVACGGSN